MPDWPGDVSVLVTGGNGFIGERLMSRLLASRARVRLLSRDGLRGVPQATTVTGDVTLPDSLSTAAEGCDVIFHCAATGGGTLDDVRAVNVEGTRNVLQAAVRAGARRVIHLSSVAVHGNDLPDRVTENQPLIDNGSPYAVSKAEGEAIALSYHTRGEIEVCVIRPTCVYGPRSATWVLAPFGRVRDEQILLVDGGWGLINLVYVDDLVDLMFTAATHSAAAGEVFIANGEAVEWWAYLGGYAAMLGKPAPQSVSLLQAKALAEGFLWRYRFTRSAGRLVAGDIQQQMNRSVFVADKSHLLLGLAAATPFAEGMRKTRDWLRDTGYLPAPRYTSSTRQSAA
jgi:nucleoside-diphosphate-sugar epimerase